MFSKRQLLKTFITLYFLLLTKKKYLYLRALWVYTNMDSYWKYRDEMYEKGEYDDILSYDEYGEKNKYHSRIFSSNPQVPVLDIYYNLGPSLVNEGDLDRNGTTEFGILDTWTSSNCRRYRIYTLKDYCWYYIVEPLNTSYNLRASGLELAESTKKKGKIRIRYSDEPRTCNYAPINDTIISATFLPIDKE